MRSKRRKPFAREQEEFFERRETPMTQYPGTDDPLEDQVADLRTRLARLEGQLTHDNQTRKELLDATSAVLPALDARAKKWEALAAAHVEALRKAPEIERLREEGLL